MNTLWTVVTIATVVAIVAVVLWALVVAPFTVPSHSAKP
jgi:signal peptidase I